MSEKEYKQTKQPKNFDKPFESTQSMQKGELYYGETLIRYDIVRQPKSIKQQAKHKIRIKICPDGQVIVTAPDDASLASIYDAVYKQARKIWQGLQEFAQQQDNIFPKRYVSGETQFYLGRRYVLKVQSQAVEKAKVKLSRGKLMVTLRQSKYPTDQTHDNNADAERIKQVRALLEQWYHNRAQVVFAERLEALLPKTTWVEGIPDFKIMTMKTQWGSCSTKGHLLLNRHLIKAPKVCIDYVILHELCHIKEHNHSEQFWRLLMQVMPDYKAVKRKLDDMAEMYLNE